MTGCATQDGQHTAHETEASAHAHVAEPVSDWEIQQQRQNLAENSLGKGFGPQAPRDIDSPHGTNPRVFGAAPEYAQMNLCDIHFHKHAEHKGGEFTTYAGNGDGHGYKTGFRYSGTLSTNELEPTKEAICPSQHGAVYPGDTIEVHYVYSTANAAPGNSLSTCFQESTVNPQLRVEAQVFVLVNDKNALDFVELNQVGKQNGYYQALGLLNNTGDPVQYIGSTTGPSYNEQPSPFQVTWSVRPKVAKVNIETVGQWCKSNEFDENHAHGVRNLVVNQDMLSEIER
ncbi:MAG: hypothetical protein LAT77_01785 [Aliidiomarina sp.]|uniref:delta-class carbonic anhydrase n=1 Tax=Aliidiomarina sp. TaxID=1872439 RepID=UPI0025C2A9B0|nr:delta-class carbonic anhydrase [Aliidiomarina sp.]MCH8500621.1 hypothetical protein [Aliidiomarina sp.]